MRISIVLMLVSLPLSAQEDRLKSHWTGLKDAWKALGEPRSEKAVDLTDGFLLLLGRTTSAMERAGLFEPDAAIGTSTVKRLFRMRLSETLCLTSASSAGADDPNNMARIFELLNQRGRRIKLPQVPSNPLLTLENAFRKLNEVQAAAPADGDRIQEAWVEARKALKGAGLMTDETSLCVRRRIERVARALLLGEPYPELPRPTSDREREIRTLIDALADTDPETREKATANLKMTGEEALPFLQEALHHADREVVERVKLILRLPDPAPKPEPADDYERSIVAPLPVAPPNPPQEPDPEDR